MSNIFTVGWIEQDSDTAAIVTATRAAPATGYNHVVMSVSASFSTTKSALLQIKDGTTVVWEHYIYDEGHFEFPAGIEITQDAACSAVLASGGGSIVGKVNLTGIDR